jgi:hypothetical protein
MLFGKFGPGLAVPSKKSPAQPGVFIRESSMDAFLKMIDDLQTPKHKTNHIKYRRCFPQYVIR